MDPKPEADKNESKKIAPKLIKNLKLKVKNIREQRARKRCPKPARNEIVTQFHKRLQEREIARFEVNSPKKVSFEALYEIA